MFTGRMADEPTAMHELQTILIPAAPVEAVPVEAAPAEWAGFLDIGASPARTGLRAQVRRVAPYFRTALLTGAPGALEGARGCGEEAVARALHAGSPLAERAFRRLSAAEAEACFAPQPGPYAFPEGLLYLPEAGKLSPRAQAGLARLLRERSQHTPRIVAPRISTPRIVAYDAQGLRAALAGGNFSHELAQLLGAVRIALPPLRECAEDIPALLDHALATAAEDANVGMPTLLPDFTAAAAGFAWPGNLDQLQAAACWLVRHRAGLALGREDLRAALEALAARPATGPPPTSPVRMVKLDCVLQEHIRAVLSGCNGNKLRTAAVLGISRSTLYRMLDGVGPADRPAGLALAG